MMMFTNVYTIIIILIIIIIIIIIIIDITNIILNRWSSPEKPTVGRSRTWVSSPRIPPRRNRIPFDTLGRSYGDVLIPEAGTYLHHHAPTRTPTPESRTIHVRSLTSSPTMATVPRQDTHAMTSSREREKPTEQKGR